VCRAFDMAQALWVNLHYLSCASGVGLSPRKPE
jgi:hypothetical protein